VVAEESPVLPCVLQGRESAVALPLPPSAPMTLVLSVWEHELAYDVNKTFLLEGVEFGFRIIDTPCDLCNSFSKNYRSVLLDDRIKVETQILKEINLGRYIVVDRALSVVSSLGAVPKSNGKVRVIHDLSRPHGGINKFGVNSSVKYSTLDDALKFVKKDSFLAKLDLSEAYRSVPIHESCFELTGLSWNFTDSLQKTYMYDARLPFGSSLSCMVFQSLSDAIIRMFERRGFSGISYIDDFLIVSDSEFECQCALQCLVDLIESLGLVVNWDKVALPSREMTFLGVSINCIDRTISLPHEKLLALKTLLVKWSNLKSCTKKDLQSFVGKLNWAARVIRGGRTFMRNLIDNIHTNMESHHFVRLTKAAKSDIAWWMVGVSRFHGHTPF
jgi:hypothetical protein